MGPRSGWALSLTSWMGVVASREGRQERSGFWHLLPAACMGMRLGRAVAVVASASCSLLS